MVFSVIGLAVINHDKFPVMKCNKKSIDGICVTLILMLQKDDESV